MSVGGIETDEQTADDLETPPEEGEEVAPEVAGPVSSAPGAAIPGGAGGNLTA